MQDAFNFNLVALFATFVLVFLFTRNFAATLFSTWLVFVVSLLGWFIFVVAHFVAKYW